MANAGNTVKLTYHLTNGSILTDPNALIVDTEVLTGLLDGSSVPRRDSTPTFTLRATGQAPTPGDSEQTETVDTVYPDNDGLLVNRGLQSTWDLARTGLDTERRIHGRLGQVGKLVAMAACSVILLVGMVFAFGSRGDEKLVESGGSSAPAPRPTPPVILPPSDARTP